jgi:two-component system OmpR family response regulator
MITNPKLVYIVDDEPLQRDMLTDHLKSVSGYELHAFSTGEEVLGAMKVRPPAICFLDYNLSSQVRDAMDGIEVLQEIKNLYPDTEVVMISGQDSIEVAVNTMKYGAFDYVVKGEGAFVRAEKAVFNIYRYNKLQGNANRYRKLTMVFATVVVLLALLVIYLYQKGAITDSPGWL